MEHDDGSHIARPWLPHPPHHLCAVNVGLLVINLMSPQPRNYWFIWPLIGWGLGILGHAYLVSRAPDTSAMSKRENDGPGGPSVK